ncbi:MAG: DUF5676 family membrane protein [Patescibacteria group bacterium]
MIANAFALATGILWIICSLFIYLFPKFSLTVTNWWLHGMNIDELGPFALNWSNFIWGGVTLIISFWIIGYVLMWSIGFLNKK